MSCSAIIVAAGSGSRMKTREHKQWLDLCGMPMLARTLLAFESCPLVTEIILVCAPSETERAGALGTTYGISKIRTVVPGGACRQESVFCGLRHAEGEIVLVHDGARPFVKETEIKAVIDGVKRWGAAAAAVPVKDTIKRAGEDGLVLETPPRAQLWAAATPQGFYRERLLQLHTNAAGGCATDDCMLAENAGDPVGLVRCGEQNIKVTTPEDLQLARLLLKKGEEHMRIGNGYDVHRLVPGRKLILGGVPLDYELGLDGHSDADVLVHAVMDALLGAAALGDIGQHFPDTDPAYRGISSLELLKHVGELLSDYRISNIDAIVAAQRPKLAGAIPAMRENIARALGIAPEQVSVKATTTEKLGFEGRGEGISAYAVCLLEHL